MSAFQTFVAVFRLELRYRFRQWTTWLLFGAIAAATWLLLIDLMIGDAQGTANGLANAPATIAMVTSIATMLMLVAAAWLFGDAGARDAEARTESLIWSAPVSKHGYLAGRFAGALTITALLLAVAALGIIAVELQRGARPELFGAFRLAAYVQPYFVFALPTAFAAGAILFALAALSGRSVASYAGAVLLFFGSRIAVQAFGARTSGRSLAALADPFGLSALDELSRFLTTFETNTMLVPFRGALLWNRLAWIAAGAAMLAVTHLRFRPGAGERRRSRRDARVPVRETALRLGEPLPQVSQLFTSAGKVRQALEIARRSLADLFLTRTAVAGVIVLLALIVRARWSAAGVILDTPARPVTYLIAHNVLSGAGAVIVLLSALAAGELWWRERDARLSEMTDASPVPEWVPLAGKFGAVVLALAAVQLALLLGGIALQISEGYFDFELALYAKILFGIQLPSYVVWAALALSIHVVVNRKYAGHLLFVAVWALFRFGRSALGIEHNLLAYAADPGWSYSDLSGFEPFLVPWLSFNVYWGAWALLLLLLASLFRARAGDARLAARMRDAKQRCTPRFLSLLGAASAGVLVSGGWIFFNTAVLNEYRTLRERQDLRAGYERTYKRYEALPQPVIARATLHIELYPRQRTAEIRGTYRLVNDSAAPIRSVQVLVDEDVRSEALDFDRRVSSVHRDARHRFDVFELAEPLQPGETMQLRFRVVHARRGFTNDRAAGELVGNGSYFDRSWLPMIGYQRALELTDATARRERGLAPRSRFATANDARALRIGSSIRDAHWLHLETVIGTEADQIAVAPGSLRRTYAKGGRRYFHYATDAPAQNVFGFFSARYAVRRDTWNGVALEVLYEPRHGRNVERIVQAMKAALDYHTRNFGAYPHRELRMVEFPRHRGTYARAFPAAMALSEGFGFIAKPEDGIDYPFLVTAHEVAHQWWANQLRPAVVEGNQVLTETLAHYGALMAMEKSFGREPVERARALLLENYLVGRRGHPSGEVPLLRSDDQSFIHYDKGALVMYALRHELGEERVNAALRRLFQRYRFAGPPYPTALDLYAELQAVTPPERRELLRDLFERITLWDLRARKASRERLPDGTYRVDFTLSAVKSVADAIGRDVDVPMNDLVDIAVFGDRASEPLYLGKHRLRAGEQTISVTVSGRPARAVVDPHRILLERELSGDVTANNAVTIADAR